MKNQILGIICLALTIPVVIVSSGLSEGVPFTETIRVASMALFVILGVTGLCTLGIYLIEKE